MVKLGVVLLVAVTYCSLSTSDLTVEYYSWRDFEGIVPGDAFSVGLSKHGVKIYIGQVLYEGMLVPGQIYENDENIYFEWSSKEHKSKDNVKILCAKDPGKLRWISTTKDNVRHLVDTTLIKGGFEPKLSTYIGRETTDHVVAGKVVCNAQICFGLYTTEGGVAKESTSFEILSFAPPKDAPLIDYYWRDYNGVLPDDALLGGLDKKGNKIYIGQALFENKLVPGQIYRYNAKVYFEMYGTAMSNTTYNRILCTQTPNNFEWYATNATEIKKMDNKILVNGGYEPNTNTFVGRVFARGETIVGKIICDLKQCLGLYVANNGTTLMFKSSFEILTYKNL